MFAIFASIDESLSQYHADRQYLSRSQITDFLACGPQAFYDRHVSPQTNAKLATSAGLAYGTLVHLWLELGDEGFWARVRPVPAEFLTATGARSKKGDSWAEELAASEPEAIPLAEADVISLRAQTVGIGRNPAAPVHLRSRIIGKGGTELLHGHRQVLVRWTLRRQRPRVYRTPTLALPA
ncbi:MAG: hypothetical protein NTY87_07475 [Planctomycetia bacterium]|nr:hypothetical protein [Planctomycetia bacterium]